ncbi:DUF4390 domain-containing protein [Pseudodesulfovibrio indicus]|uniref:DUF4390 domain-containing protein n=1 Tax=Pseudodesulfovibrio indicus TaxID=1716143 RepID=UPI00292CAE4D|nr:DUF4390 domain-containing protein [Pseudodesulfovibrio indicus]
MRIQHRNRAKFPAGIMLAILILALLASAGPVLAQSLSLTPPSLANVDGRVTARFGVVVEKPILKGELMDGAVLVLKCAVRLVEPSDYWLDREVAEGEFVSRISFDALTREFVLTLPGGRATLRDEDLSKVLDEGWGSIETPLGAWSQLEHGRKYSLKLSTSMNQEDAPEGVMRFIYFWSWDAGANNTFQLDFTF